MQNTQMTRDFNERKTAEWVAAHNAGTMKGTIHGRTCIVTNIPPEKLSLPDGWYYNDKNGVTNKGNSSTGLYSCIDIVKY